MESRNDAPDYLRSENDDISEDLAKSLPMDEEDAGKKDLKDSGSPDKEEWQHRLREELSAGREEKDFTD